jgi:hypothetical protein
VNSLVVEYERARIDCSRPGADEPGKFMAKHKTPPDAQQAELENADDLLDEIVHQLKARGCQDDDPLLAPINALYELASSRTSESLESDKTNEFKRAFSDQWGEKKQGRKDRKFDIRSPQRHDSKRQPPGLKFYHGVPGYLAFELDNRETTTPWQDVLAGYLRDDVQLRVLEQRSKAMGLMPIQAPETNEELLRQIKHSIDHVKCDPGLPAWITTEVIGQMREQTGIGAGGPAKLKLAENVVADFVKQAERLARKLP